MKEALIPIMGEGNMSDNRLYQQSGSHSFFHLHSFYLCGRKEKRRNNSNKTAYIQWLGMDSIWVHYYNQH